MTTPGSALGPFALRAHQIGKAYPPSPMSARRRLHDEVAHPAAAPVETVNDCFWALRDLDLDVSKGDTVGIVGRNGAGKSTLLKILSRITPPTTGEFAFTGTLASLLEVGSGFHRELTGRENVFLNGAILGMRRADIARRFDSIVAFSGVEPFIDMPVKHYSTGMHMRLAFAVAAHLDSDILLVDEVLAVGDLEFQKKCLGKMQDVASEGRTVFLVSHNLAAVRRLCSHTLLLDGGRRLYFGPTEECLDRYVRLTQSTSATGWTIKATDAANGAFFNSLEIVDDSGAARTEFRIGEPWTARVCFELTRPVRDVRCALGIISLQHGPVATQWSPITTLDPGKYFAVCRVSRPLLAAGVYTFALGLSTGGAVLHYVEECGRLTVWTVARGEQPASAASGVVLMEDSLTIEHCDRSGE